MLFSSWTCKIYILSVCVSVHLRKVLMSFIVISSPVMRVLCIHFPTHQGCIWLLGAYEKEKRVWSTELTLIEVNPEQRAIILPPHGFHWEFQHSNLTLLQRVMSAALVVFTAAAETQFGWNKHETAAALNVPSLFYTRNNKLSCNTGMWISWSSSTFFICIESRREY